MKLLFATILTLICAKASYSQQSASSYNFASSTSIEYNKAFIKKNFDDRYYWMAYQQVYEYYSSRKDTAALLDISYLLLRRPGNYIPWRKSGGPFRTPTQLDKAYNRAAETVSMVYQARSKYDSALYYLYRTDTVYAYFGDCGNDINMHAIDYACRYADLYLKLGDQKSAVNALLKQSLNDEHNKHIKKLQSLLATYNRTELKTKLKTKLKAAIASYKPSAFKYDGGNYYIIFLGVRAPFYFWNENSEAGKVDPPASVIAHLEQTPFYKMVMAL